MVVLSNHIAWLVSSPFPWLIPKFIGFVHGNISREIGTLHDWPGKLWKRPARPLPCVDETKKSPAPPCHASTVDGLLSYREKYRMFVEAFRAAAAWLREKAHPHLSEVAKMFPSYAFPPGMPMVMPSG